VHVSLLDPVLSLLDRQLDALAGQPGSAEFLVSVEPFLRALESEPRIAIHLEDLREETLGRVRVLEDVDAELLPELIALRKRLTSLRPVLDDSDAPAPDEGGEEDAWTGSLACFDVIAGSAPKSSTTRVMVRVANGCSRSCAPSAISSPHNPLGKMSGGWSTCTTSPSAGRT
jgi:hypothetical protein